MTWPRTNYEVQKNFPKLFLIYLNANELNHLYILVVENDIIKSFSYEDMNLFWIL